MRFQWSISLPSRGAFHRSLAVLCAIGRHRYLALEGGPPRFPRATSCPVVLAHASRRGAGFRLRGSHPLWRTLPGPSSSHAHSPSGPRQRATKPPHNPSPTTPAGLTWAWFRLLPVRSPLLGEYCLFLGVLRCFSSPTYLHTPYVFRRGWRGMTPAGLPHSGIDGTLPACGPPSLFAACHALHRPVSPRHPPHTHHRVKISSMLSKIQITSHVILIKTLFTCQSAAPPGGGG